MFSPYDVLQSKGEQMKKDIIQLEIEKARDARCFFAELTLALTIPSVCSRYGLTVEELKRQNESIRYPMWYDQYVYPYFQILTGKECYAVRCAILHNGDIDIYSQPIMHRENQQHNYRLMIPDYGSNFCLRYEENQQLHDRPFCAAGLAIQILEGYERFKEEYPEFEYPLSRNVNERQGEN